MSSEQPQVPDTMEELLEGLEPVDGYKAWRVTLSNGLVFIIQSKATPRPWLKLDPETGDVEMHVQTWKKPYEQSLRTDLILHVREVKLASRESMENDEEEGEDDDGEEEVDEDPEV